MKTFFEPLKRLAKQSKATTFKPTLPISFPLQAVSTQSAFTKSNSLNAISVSYKPIRFFSSNNNAFNIEVDGQKFPQLPSENPPTLTHWAIEFAKYLQAHSLKDPEAFKEACLLLRQVTGERLEECLTTMAYDHLMSYNTSGSIGEEYFEILAGIILPIRTEENRKIFCEIFSEQLNKIFSHLSPDQLSGMTPITCETRLLLFKAFPHLVREFVMDLQAFTTQLDSFNTLREPTRSYFMDQMISYIPESPKKGLLYEELWWFNHTLENKDPKDENLDECTDEDHIYLLGTRNSMR